MSDEILSDKILAEEYGFPASARLLPEGEELQPGDYLINPELKQIAFAGRCRFFHVHKKNRLAPKLRQQSKRRPDADNFVRIARIDPADFPLTHQMALLPKGARVEIPKGKFGRITDDGIAYKDKTIEFVDVTPEMIHDLHPPQVENKKPQKHRAPGKGGKKSG